jgi:cytochrome c5
MSDAHPTPDHDGPHEGPIKTPKQLVWAVVFAFLVPIIVIVLLINFVAADKKPAAGTEALAGEALALRIQKIGTVIPAKDMNDLASLRSGEQVYQQQCSSCHANGGGINAPILGDAAAWGPRIGQGYDTLRNSALNGKGKMSAQKTDGNDAANFEVARAVVYMANAGGAKFAEPKPPAAAASGASAAQ